MQEEKKKIEATKTTFRDRFDPKNKEYFDQIRAKELQIKAEEQKPSYLQRKMTRIFGGMTSTGGKFTQGFMQGFMVGAVIGGVTGVYAAFKTRRISMLFLSPILSGASFGFIMGVGAIIRSAEMPKNQFGPYPDGREWILKKI